MKVMGCGDTRRQSIDQTESRRETHIGESGLDIELASSEGSRSERLDSTGQCRRVSRLIRLDVLKRLDDDASLLVAQTSGSHLLETERLESSG